MAPSAAQDAVAAPARTSKEGWLAARRRSIVLLLVLGSIALRVAYFVQLDAGPCIDVHRWDQSDMHYFDGWGRAVAGGDWLSASVGVPLHTWHKQVAAEYFAGHPDARADLERRAGGAGEAEALLWSRWTGGHQFYQDPLHAYLIGLTYTIGGAEPRHVLAWQMVLGVLTNVLIYLIARQYFGDLVGVVAGALALLCGPLLHYELLLLRDSTIVFAGVALVWLADRAVSGGRWPWFGALGVALGCAAMLKSTFVLLGLLVAAGVVLHARPQVRKLRLPAGAALMGLLISLMPFAARNAALGVSPLALTAGSGPLTFVASNGLTYPTTGGFYVEPTEVARVLSTADGGLLAAVVETLRPHSLRSLSALLWHKFENTWHWYEIPNNVNFYYWRLRAPILAWLPVTFYALAPLGLVGLVLAAGRVRQAWPLYLLVLTTVASLVAFLVLGRLRALLLAAVIPFAALTLVDAVRARPRRAVTIALAVVLLGIWTGRSLPASQPLIGVNDWLLPFLVRYQFQVKTAMDANDPTGVAQAYLEFLRYEPDFSRMVRSGEMLRTATDREAARTFAQIHDVCAAMLRAAGDEEQGRRQTQEALRLHRLAGAGQAP